MSSRTLSRLAPLFIALVAACGGKGCSCLGPIKGGFPIDERRHENAMQVRVTAGAVQWLQDNVQQLVVAAVGGMAGGSGSTFNVPPSGCGGKNQVCCGNPSPMCRIQIDIDQKNTTLTLAPPNALHVDVAAALKTLDKLPVDYDTGFAGTAHCYVELDTSMSTTQYKSIQLVTDATFAVDGTTRLTSITLANTAVNHLDKSMLTLSSQPSDTFRLCTLAGNISQIQDYLVKQLATQLADQITSTAKSSFCASCMTQDDCDGWADSCGSGKCQRGGACLQEIGAQGRLDLGALFASLSPNTVAGLDTIAVLGGYADVTPMATPGISLGLLGGGQADPHSSCVPMRTPPAPVAVDQWGQYTGETEPATMKPYHVGVAIHQSHLNQMAFAAFDAGGLCLDVGTASQPLLNTQTLAAIMPSLADLTHDQAAPMFLALRPTQEPQITLGAGTFKMDSSGNRVIDDPLLHVDVLGFGMDFYAFVDDRYVRVMTLTSDIHLGVSLDVDAQGRIVPLFGDLKSAFQNLKVTNSELLSESPDKLAKTFPALLGVAIGQIGGTLKPIALPSTMGLALQVVAIEPTDSQQNLSVFANLMTAMTSPALHATTKAHIAHLALPDTATFSVEEMDPAKAPRVTLSLDGTPPAGATRGLEWSYAVDDGPWSPYTDDAAPTLTDPLLWLQGRHHLDVRARVVGQPETTDEQPVRLDFLVDTIAPKVSVDEAGGEAWVRAKDNVTPAARLEYSVLVDGRWSDYQRVDLARFRLADVGGVRVRDEAGNVAPVDAAFHGRKTAASSGGCSCRVGDGGDPLAGLATALLCLGGLLVPRRRRGLASLPSLRAKRAAYPRARVVVALLAASTALSACNSDYTLQPNDVEPVNDEIGRFDDVAVDEKAGVLHVSAYDDTLGDLVYAQIPVAPLESGMAAPAIQWQWVDGVPAGSDPTGKLSRRGATDPGDDVGQYSSIGLTAKGDVVIAYFDATHRQLKLARGSIHDRKLTATVVDAPAMGSAATVGLYASLSLDAAGVPSVAYSVIGLPNQAGDGFVSRLRLATAKVAAPTGPNDWTTVDVDETPMSCAGVGKVGLCSSSQACVLLKMHDPSSSLCRAVDTSCTSACAKGTACVAGMCQPVLVPAAAPDLAEGTGLFANLRRLSTGKRVIVYYDREQGDLKIAAESDGGGFTKAFLDGNSPETDVGQFAAAAVASDDSVHVAYVDAIGDRLLYQKATATKAGSIEVVDDGMRPDGPHPVGAGATVLVGDPVRVAYQDQASSDLWLATGSGASWTKQAVRMGAPGYGFYPHLVTVAGKLFVVEFAYDRGAEAPAPLGALEVKALP